MTEAKLVCSLLRKLAECDLQVPVSPHRIPYALRPTPYTLHPTPYNPPSLIKKTPRRQGGLVDSKIASTTSTASTCSSSFETHHFLDIKLEIRQKKRC